MRVASRRRRQTPPRRRPRRQPPPRPRSQQPARGGRPEQRGENRIRSRTDPMPPTLTSVGRSHFRFEYFFWRRDLAFFSRGGRSDTNIHIQSGFGSTFVVVSTISGFLAGMAATGSAGYIYTRRARGVMGEDNRYSFFSNSSFSPRSINGAVSGGHRGGRDRPGPAGGARIIAGLSSPHPASGNAAPPHRVGDRGAGGGIQELPPLVMSLF